MTSLIVIPTYNERENIAALIEQVFANAPSVDLLIVDDNSPDGTSQLVESLAAKDSRIHLLRRPGKMGLGTAYIAGFRYAIAHGYDFVFEMDADFSHDPRYLPRFLQEAQSVDLVIGSRYIAGGGTPNWKPIRRFISGGGNLFARTLLGIPIHDCTGGFRCYRVSALRTLNLDAVSAQGYAFQVELAYNMWKSGYTWREIPIIFEDRRVGKSKMSRTIFIEAFLWVTRTRFTGDKAVRQRPSISAADAVPTERPRS